MKVSCWKTLFFLTVLHLQCVTIADPIYSPGYFWFWNDRLDVEKLCSQLEDMHAHGLRNVCIHPMPKAFRPVWCSTKM